MARKFRGLRRIAGVAALTVVAASAAASPAQAQSASECQRVNTSGWGDSTQVCYGTGTVPVWVCASVASDDQFRSYYMSVGGCAHTERNPVWLTEDCYNGSQTVIVCTGGYREGGSPSPEHDLCVVVRPNSAVERAVCLDGIEANAEFARTFADTLRYELERQIANAPQTVAEAFWDAMTLTSEVYAGVDAVVSPITTQVNALVNKAIADTMALLDREVCTPSAGPPPVCASIG
jgi:hypothetical protein